MILRIDTTSGVPVYAQIVEQVKRAVASGALKAGDGLPSLRETAVKLRINPLTVSKAYKELERAGVIETKHGLGSFVCNNTGASQEFRLETIERAIDDLLVDAFHLGVSFEELRDLIEDRMEAANDGFAREITEERDGEDGK